MALAKRKARPEPLFVAAKQLTPSAGRSSTTAESPVVCVQSELSPLRSGNSNAKDGDCANRHGENGRQSSQVGVCRKLSLRRFGRLNIGVPLIESVALDRIDFPLLLFRRVQDQASEVGRHGPTLRLVARG